MANHPPSNRNIQSPIASPPASASAPKKPRKKREPKALPVVVEQQPNAGNLSFDQEISSDEEASCMVNASAIETIYLFLLDVKLL